MDIREIGTGNAAVRRITAFTILMAIAGLFAVAAPQAAIASGSSIYTANFEVLAGPEWSNTSESVTPSGRGFLGEFGNHTTTLSLVGLPLHATLTVSFDLYVLKSWDGSDSANGPDVWDLSAVGGPTLLHSTFSNAGQPQSYPDPFPGPEHSFRTGAAEVDTLGYTFFGDSVYHITASFPHAATSVALAFQGSGLQGVGDESWGIDNVAVTMPLPSAPANLHAVASSAARIDLTWDAVPEAASYNVLRSSTPGGPYALIGKPTAASFPSKALSQSTTYYYVVRAVNTAGTSLNSTEASATTLTLPTAPVNLQAVTVSASRINLTWDAVPGASSYNVVRSTAPGGLYTLIARPTATTYANQSLSQSSTYYYVVRAVNTAGISSNSTEASATTMALPSVPVNLQAVTASASRIDLTWDAVAEAASYNLLRATTPGGPYTLLGKPTATSFPSKGLSQSTTYYYVVRAVNSAGISPNSTEASGTTMALPSVPANLQAVTASTSRINLTWDVVAGATSYSLVRATTPGGPYTLIARPTSTSFANTGLAQSTTFYYVVRAVNSAGTSPNSAEASATTMPATPANLQAVTASASRIDLTWDAVAGVTNYEILRSTTPGGPYTPIASPLPRSFADTGLSPSTTFSYVVRAVNSAGTSPNSTEASATTMSLPPAPTNLQAVPASSSRIDLTWNAVAGATSYDLLRSTTPGGPYTLIASPTTLSFANTGLPATTTFSYVVRAVTSAGTSPNSTEASATTTVPLSPQEKYVDHAFRDFAGRAATTGELANFSPQVGSTPNTRIGAVRGIAHTQDSLTFIVTNMYIRLLGRTPTTGTSGETQFWVNQLTNPAVPGSNPPSNTFEAVIADILSSAEFLFSHGNDAGGYVDGVFDKLLRRAPDPATGERDFWINKVNQNGGIGSPSARRLVPVGILQSRESRSRAVRSFYGDPALNPNPFQGYYINLLHRTQGTLPPQSEIDFWVNSPDDSFTIEQTFAASDEYFNLAQL